MAGICGWVDTTLPKIELEKTLARMADALPLLGTTKAFNTTRATGLSAISTFHGDTSFSRAEIKVAIVGEPRWLDDELHKLAETSGHAEALVHAYFQYHCTLLEHLKGTFVLAIVDIQNHTAILAIDRMGIRPLCFAVTRDKGLVFGSTIEAIRQHPNVSKEIDPQALFDYAYFHVIPSPQTIHKGIRKLQPGHFLIFREGQTTIRRYWTPTFLEYNQTSFENLSDELLQILRNVVRRCATNGATGTFLSGGTDSSTVTGILAELRDHPIKAYSIGFSAEGYNEVPYSRITARHFGVDLHEYYVTQEDVTSAIPEIACAYDEPYGNSSAVPTLFCTRHAYENGTRIMLAGDGGDEIFAGNERYATQKLFESYALLPKWFRTSVIETLFLDFPASNWFLPTRKIRRYIEQARLQMPERMQTYNFLHRIDPNSIFEPDFLSAVSLAHPMETLREEYFHAPSESLLNRMLYLDWKLTLADNDLPKVNRMSQLAGIKIYYPLLDDDLVEFSNRIPPSLKLKGWKLRYFFKQALRDFLPLETIIKSKHGFGLPFGQWLKTSQPLQSLIYSNLNSLSKRGIVKEPFIKKLIELHRSDHAAYYGTMIWVLAMLEQWFQEHRIHP
jgi:asparagine synthase (glutamine-hydrolysing)